MAAAILLYKKQQKSENRARTPGPLKSESKLSLKCFIGHSKSLFQTIAGMKRPNIPTRKSMLLLESDFERFVNYYHCIPRRPTKF